MSTLVFSEFKEEYAEPFYRLNVAWLKEFFVVEPVDEKVLSDPKKYILDPGGFILFALKSDHVIGCVAMKPDGKGAFEMTKMAVDKPYQSQGIGSAMISEVLRLMGLRQINLITLFSSSILHNAVHLYEKFGFLHKPMPSDNVYKRGDVYMELHLNSGWFQFCSFYSGALKQFQFYKSLGDQTINRLSSDQLNWQVNSESNSIAIIMHHMAGNMVSRWTNFLTEDGEKEWRQRDAEFEPPVLSHIELLDEWEHGWNSLYNALRQINPSNFAQTIYIRNLGLSITDAISRQLCHYSYHVGQIVFIGKMILNEDWKSLSISKGTSSSYNSEKFAQPKEVKHFTDEFLKK